MPVDERESRVAIVPMGADLPHVGRLRKHHRNASDWVEPLAWAHNSGRSEVALELLHSAGLAVDAAEAGLESVAKPVEPDKLFATLLK
jgi:hypothetical protein